MIPDRPFAVRLWSIKVLLLAAAVMSASLLVVMPERSAQAAPQGTPDANCSASRGFTEFFSARDSRIAQTFTAIHSGQLTSAQMRVIKDPGSSGDYVLELRAVNSSGAPTGTILASTTIPNSTVPDGTSTIIGSFGSPATVVAGQQYALAVGRPGSSNTLIVFGTGGNPCPGSGYFAFASAGPFTEETDFGGFDYFFATFVTPQASPPPPSPPPPGTNPPPPPSPGSPPPPPPHHHGPHKHHPKPHKHQGHHKPGSGKGERCSVCQ